VVRHRTGGIDGSRWREGEGSIRRLTSGEHAAAATHGVGLVAYLSGRIYDDEGQAEQAKAQYQEALAVSGSPDQHDKQRKRSCGLQRGKPPERP